MADLCTSTPASAVAPVQVRILAKHTLAPASPTPRHPFFLPCLDILWQEIHYNRRVLFYRRPQLGCPAASDLPFLQQLQHSLSLCLVHYYPWCGRIAKGTDPPHRLFIDCNDAGVEFFEASIDMPLSLLAQDGFQMKPFFEQLCQQPDHKGDCLFSSPLLTIQATLFSDGGLALGISQSHMVADGQSLWNFMISWAECSRGVPLSLPPLHDRQRLALPDPSLEKASHWRFVAFPLKEEDTVEEELEPASVSKEEEKGSVETEASANGDGRSIMESNSSADSDKRSDVETNALHDDPLVQWAFDLPSSAVKKLKSEAGEGFTSYEVICAHFWQRTTFARQTPKQNVTYFTVLADCRRRMIPPLPSAYFGNVISFGVLLSTVYKISNEALHTTASRIHELVVKVQDESVNFMHYLETHDNRVLHEARNMPRGKGHNVASSPRFPVYQVDFGWGKPVAVRPGKAGAEGEIIFFGGRPEATGDIEICTALPASVLKRLLEDPVFLAKPTSTRCASEAM